MDRDPGAIGEPIVPGFTAGWLPELNHRLYAETPAEIPKSKRARASAPRAKLHALASELSELESLRSQTVRDPLWAAMATAAIGESVANALPKDKPAPHADEALRVLEGIQTLRENHDSPGLDAVEEQAGERLDALESAAEAWCEALDESAIRQSMRRAIASASDAISEAENALRCLGHGLAPGQSNTTRDPSMALNVARKVRGSSQLQRIMAMAGRLVATARHKRASRADYKRGEIVGVEPTREISRVLPSELVGLSTSAGTAALYRKCIEGAALGYRTESKQAMARGPIVVAIDASGSMQGDRDAWAKGIALALFDIAKTERRPFAALTYDANVRRTVRAFLPAELDTNLLIDLLTDSPSGGTDFGPAMWEVLNWIGKGQRDGLAMGRADVILVTDGEANARDAAAVRHSAKALGATIYGVAIAAPASVLAAWTDEATEITDVANDAAAVNLVFDSVLA